MNTVIVESISKYTKPRFFIPIIILSLFTAFILLFLWHSIPLRNSDPMKKEITVMDSENTACYGEYASLLEGIRFLGFEKTSISKKEFEAMVGMMVCIDPAECPRFAELLGSDKRMLLLTPADLFLFNLGLASDMERAQNASEIYRNQVHIDKVTYDWRTYGITIISTGYSTSESIK